MKNTVQNNIRAFRDQIRAEELKHEARIVTRDSYYLDLVSPREEIQAQGNGSEPFGFNPFMGLTLE